MTDLDYAEAGVSINSSNDLVNKIKPLARSTQNNYVLQPIGGFAGLFELPPGYKRPVLVAATDGVGTKLKIANALNKHNTIGIDLVAMCVNDIIVTGARPLFFLDYYATGKLDITVAEQVIESIITACQETGMSLLGGETAEMPGIYQRNDYDLAGFCVGVAEHDNLLSHNKVQAGDLLIGLSSSGVHSNGFSLVRKILEVNNISLDGKINNQSNQSIGEILLTPTVLYSDPLYKLIIQKKIVACAHITGGGLLENTLRVIPDNLAPNFDLNNYKLPEIFQFLQNAGNISSQEMWRVFNCGIGMVLIVRPCELTGVLDYYDNYAYNQYNQTSAFVIGEITNKNYRCKNLI